MIDADERKRLIIATAATVVAGLVQTPPSTPGGPAGHERYTDGGVTKALRIATDLVDRVLQQAEQEATP